MDPGVNGAHTCTRSALDLGLASLCFSETKYGVEAEGEESPKRIGAAAKAEEIRGFGRAGAVEMRCVRRLSTLYSSSSSSKKKLLGSNSGT
jgi:hypothetical protein